MATRTIVTSQPDVECDVCERRLLRGEHPDVFVSAGRRRIVCELCAPRATHAGWLRETASQPVSLPPARPRRGGGLFERLRRVTQPAASAVPDAADGGGPLGVPSALEGVSSLDRASALEALPVDVPASAQASGQATVGAPADTREEGLAQGLTPMTVETAAELQGAAPAATPTPMASETALAHEAPSAYLREAIEVFNASEFPRRVAGVIRSLGAPLVTVRSAEHLASVVRIVVAWELCWYRYEVDLSEPEAQAQVIAQGTELAELAREDRAGNAAAIDGGSLTLA
jgi:hypothetical protein